MLISFVLVVNSENEKFLDTIKSIEKQTTDNWELILTVDNNETKLENSFLDYFNKHKNFKLIVNTSIQGTAVSWNSSMDIAEGDYVVFTKSGDIISPNFVEKIQKNSKNSPDLIEFKMVLSNIANSETRTYVELDKIYDVSTDLIPFAYINDLIHNKCFKTSILKENFLRFRRFLRYDMLFAYKFLSHSKTYVHISEDSLVDCKIEQIQYSAFDIVNQWPHILNYYRRIGKYKELRDYLNYSFYKVMIHTWMWSVKRYNNKLLIKKAANFAERKFLEKKEDFVNKNSIYELKKDSKFTEIIENFDKYIKDIIKLSK